jgi:drug/metabolite transporter (DMT)-like permease
MRKALIYIGVIAAMLFWALTFVWVKQLLEQGFTATMLIFFRLFIASVILLPVIIHSKILIKLTRKDKLLFLLLSFFEPFLYYIGEVNGIKHVSPNIAAIIIATIPIFLPFVMRFFIKENLNFMNYLGLFVSFLGVAIIVFNKDGSLFASVKGLLFLFMAVFSAIGYTVIAKKLLHTYPPLQLVALKIVIGCIYFVPIFFIKDLQIAKELSITPNMFGIIAALAICGNILAYFFYNTSIHQIGATKSAIFANLIPVFTIFFSFFILGDILPTSKLAGIVLTLSGIYVSQIKLISNKTKKITDKQSKLKFLFAMLKKN